MKGRQSCQIPQDGAAFLRADPMLRYVGGCAVSAIGLREDCGTMEVGTLGSGSAMWRTGLAMWVLVVTFVVVGCGAGQDKVGEDTDARRTEGVFDPVVGALHRGHRTEHLADDHNKVLDETLHESRRLQDR